MGRGKRFIWCLEISCRDSRRKKKSLFFFLYPGNLLDELLTGATRWSFTLTAMSFGVCLPSWWLGRKGIAFSVPLQPGDTAVLWARSICFCLLPRTRVLAREIVSNVGWAALPHALFCIKHFPPWKLPWLTAHFKIIINVFAQGFWNLITLFWTALSVFV